MFQTKKRIVTAFHRFRLGLELVLDFNRGVWGTVARSVLAVVTHSLLSTLL